MCEGKPAKTRIWKSDLAVCLDQVSYADVRVAVAGIPVRFFRLRRGRDDGDGLLRAVVDAGEAVFAIPFSDGAAVDQLPGTVRTDRRANAASDAGIRGEDDLFGTSDCGPRAVPTGGSVIPFADHPVHLGDRQDEVFALVDGRENGGDLLGNQLVLRVRLFPIRVKIRQVGRGCREMLKFS